MEKLTVVTPFLNEEKTLRASVDRLLKAELPVTTELILVDDGSTDGSVASVADLLDREDVRLIQHETPRGKGAALRSGIEAASGDYLTILDADLEYDPRDFRDLIEPLLQGDAEVAYGTRSFGSHTAYSFWFVVGNRLVSLWASLLFNTWLSDIETCFKMTRTEVWRSLRLRGGGFGIEAEVTGKVLKSRKRIYEVPISYTARSREEGKKLRWTDGIGALGILLWVRLFWRPRA